MGNEVHLEKLREVSRNAPRWGVTSFRRMSQVPSRFSFPMARSSSRARPFWSTAVPASTEGHARSGFELQIAKSDSAFTRTL
jgi:hypothetical protein